MFRKMCRRKRLRSRSHIWIAAAAALAVFAGGCSVSNRRIVPVAEIRPAKEATKVDLIAAFNRLARSISSLNASVELVPTAGSEYSGVIEEYHEVNAFILAQKPATIRVIGQAPVIAKNVFDMTSDGQTFHIYIPSQNKFITGPASFERSAEKPIENLRPQHLLDALFWPQISEHDSVLFEEDNETTARYYVLTLLGGGPEPQILRKLWFDRADLSLSRVQLYGTDGRLLSDIRFAEWQPVGAAQSPAAIAAGTGKDALIYPRHIWLDRPHDGYKLEIRVDKLTLNEPIPADRFHLEQPAGTELVSVGEAGSGQP